jgi:outer membrane protein OmpA-like peptidoglycan-associated protein
MTRRHPQAWGWLAGASLVLAGASLVLAGALLALAGTGSPALAQTAPTRADIVNQLGKFDTGQELDLAALRQKVLERSRSRAKIDFAPLNRSLVAPELLKLPGYLLDIQFDTDTPIVKPESYSAVGRLADALVNANLLPYNFLIVGHVEPSGRRENNAILSQRRADAIRDILVNTFKISAKRLQSVGLGEEQLLDAAHPNNPVNRQMQVVTVAKMP